jgi:hypothetical protein
MSGIPLAFCYISLKNLMKTHSKQMQSNRQAATRFADKRPGPVTEGIAPNGAYLSNKPHDIHF